MPPSINKVYITLQIYVTLSVVCKIDQVSNADIVKECIDRDLKHWETVLPKLEICWRIYHEIINPEVEEQTKDWHFISNQFCSCPATV